MNLYDWSGVEKEQLNPKIARQAIHTERVTVAKVHLSKGGVVARHQHPNEQVTLLERGRLRFTIEGESVVLEPGSVLQIPAGACHQVEALEDSVAVDIFAPPREDWIRGEDAYLRG